MSRLGGRGSGKVGEARIDIVGDNSSFKEAVGESRQELEGLANDAERVGLKAGKAFDGASDAIEGSTSSFRRLSGAISSTVGAVTGLVGAATAAIGIIALLGAGVEKLSERFKGGKERADELTSGLSLAVGQIDNTIETLQTRIDEIDDQIERITNQKDLRDFLGVNTLEGSNDQLIRLFDERNKLEDRLEIERTRRTAARRASEDRQREAQAQAEADSFLKVNELRNRLAKNRALSDRELAEQEANDAFATINELEEARRQGLNSLTQEQIRNERLRASETLQIRLREIESKERAEEESIRKREAAEEDARAKRERAEVEAIERLAERMERALESALQGIFDNQTGLFGDGGSTGVGAISAKLDNIANLIPRNIPLRGAGEVFPRRPQN